MDGLYQGPYYMLRLFPKSIVNRPITWNNILSMKKYLMLKMVSVSFLKDVIYESILSNNRMSWNESIQVVVHLVIA